MRILDNACFSNRGSKARIIWGVLTLLVTMGFCATVDFVATIRRALDFGLVTPPHGVTNVFAAPSKIIGMAPVPSIFVFIAHVMNASTIYMIISSLLRNFQCTLGDAFIAWRTWMVFERKRTIWLLFSLLIVFTLGAS
jgi:hypothetical protein